MTEMEKLVAIHKHAKENLVNFFRVFLSEGADYVKPAKFHYDLSKELIEGKKNYAIEMFRGSGKSTYALKAFPCYCLAYPRADRRYIMILKATQTEVEKTIREIITIYKTNPVLSKNIIEIHKETASMFELTVRGPNKENFKMMIEGKSKGSSIRGANWFNLRPQLIICDDIQDVDDARSDTVQAKDWDWFLSDLIFLSSTGRIFLIGNNLGERCIIERIIQAAKSFKFQVQKIPALIDGVATWGDNPDLTVKRLTEEKDAFVGQGKLDLWYRERLCLAMSEENRVFKKNMFKYFNDEDVKDKNLTYYITVDPAISQKETADDTAIVVLGKDNNSPQWYVMEYVADKLDPLELIDMVFYLNNKYRAVRVGIEMVAYQKSLLYFFEEEMRKRGEYINIVELKASNKKEERIMGIHPQMKVGNLLIRSNMTKLEEQLLAFPHGLHDDVIDAVAYLQQVVAPTSIKKKSNAEIMREYYR